MFLKVICFLFILG